jgi:uncharacterized protein (DUF2164 family)
MSVTLTSETRKQAIASLRRFCTDQLEYETSDLQAIALLDFFLKEIAPSVYNSAISDAQAFVRDRLPDLEATCFEPEFGYWPRGSSTRRKP